MLSNRDLLGGAQGNSPWTFDMKKESLRKMIGAPNMTLVAEEARTFIEWMWDETVMRDFARIVPMTSAKKKLRGIGWGDSDFLYPADVFTRDLATESFADHEIELSAKEFRGSVIIYDTDLEDLTVGTAAQFKSHIMSMVAKRMARELEEICWIGDTHSLSGFANSDSRSRVDGWRYWLDNSQSGETYENAVTGSTTILDASNTVTAKAEDFALSTSDKIIETDASAPYAQEIKYDLMLKWLPSQYQRAGANNMRFLNNDMVLHTYRMGLQARQTTLGDATINGRNFVAHAGVPIIPCPLMPRTMEVYGAGQHENYDAVNGTLTDVVLTLQGNFVIGMLLEIQMEAQREAYDVGTHFIFRTRFDVAVADVAAAVLLKRLVA